MRRPTPPPMRHRIDGFRWSDIFIFVGVATIFSIGVVFFFKWVGG
jgi:hypothetical protein